MDSFEVKISTFINRAATKSRTLAKALIEEFDVEDYQNDESRELLDKITQTRNFMDLLDTEDRGGLTEKEIHNLIDFFYWWLDLYHVVTVNYTHYSTPIEGEQFLVGSGLFALQSDLLAEIALRASQVSSLGLRIDDLWARKVTKVAHGFAVKDVLTLNGAGVLIKVTDPKTEKRIGIVTEVIDANNFRLATHGWVSGLSGLMAGTVYFVQTTGTIGTTVTEMIALVADSTTTGYLVPQSFLDEVKSDAAVETAGATITLDMLNLKERIFKGDATISDPKTWALSNADNGKRFTAFFSLDDLHALTLWAGTKMSDPRFTPGTLVWQPDSTGDFKMTATYDGANWWVEIDGPSIT